jgi:hypothetical protein
MSPLISTLFQLGCSKLGSIVPRNLTPTADMRSLNASDAPAQAYGYFQEVFFILQ